MSKVAWVQFLAVRISGWLMPTIRLTESCTWNIVISASAEPVMKTRVGIPKNSGAKPKGKGVPRFMSAC